uniref:CTCK domain-containing protein n=1 Tax=Sinocyclocheilus anshuiensis TaxID=1608454 RepID=A0A671PPS9_9TELE
QHSDIQYSIYANDLMHSCSCCKAANVTNKTVTLKCANSSDIRHNYTYINSCTCTPMTARVNALEIKLSTNTSKPTV